MSVPTTPSSNNRPNPSGQQRSGGAPRPGNAGAQRNGSSPARPGSPARPAGAPGAQRPGGGPGKPGGGPNRGKKKPTRSGKRSRGPMLAPKMSEEGGSEDEIEMEGVVSAVLAGTMFRVKLPNGHELLAHISGKMRKRFIRLVVGDRVRIEVSPYDMTKARITFRIG